MSVMLAGIRFRSASNCHSHQTSSSPGIILLAPGQCGFYEHAAAYRRDLRAEHTILIMTLAQGSAYATMLKLAGARWFPAEPP
jgi:hypothetical protein